MCAAVCVFVCPLLLLPSPQNIHLKESERTSELLDRKKKLGKPVYGGYDDDDDNAGPVVGACATLHTHPAYVPLLRPTSTPHAARSLDSRV